MSDPMDDIRENTVVLNAGEVAYDMIKAAVPIGELIDMLTSAQDEGATHIVQSSGNYRGAQWQHTSLDYMWVDDFKEYHA